MRFIERGFNWKTVFRKGIKNKILYLLAKLFGEKCSGVDYSNGIDKTIKTTGYFFAGTYYVSNIEEVE